MTSPLCPYREKCSGCQYLDLPSAAQRDLKIRELSELFAQNRISFPGSVEFLSVGEYFLRDRLDFTLQDGRLGLFAKQSREIVDIESCLQLSPPLQDWLNDFRKIQWPLQKASFRLRVSPSGLRGVWIDAANVDIKKLLIEKEILENLLRQNVAVEMGQKRKRVRATSTGLKLKDPEAEIWFQTSMGERKIPLYSQIASFTQPSLSANRKIGQQIEAWLRPLGHPRILEFGSGIGNLSFPALTQASSLTACEIDELALAAFAKSLQSAGLTDRVRIQAGDFQKKEYPDFSRYDLILCNPPRSGLMNFLNPLQETPARDLPAYFIYMSCFPESLGEDLKTLQSCGYGVRKAQIIDQFPQTRHYEVLCLLQREDLKA